MIKFTKSIGKRTERKVYIVSTKTFTWFQTLYRRNLLNTQKFISNKTLLRKVLFLLNKNGPIPSEADFIVK